MFGFEGLLTLDLPRGGSSPELGRTLAFGEPKLSRCCTAACCSSRSAAAFRPLILVGEEDDEVVAENFDGPASMDTIVIAVVDGVALPFERVTLDKARLSLSRPFIINNGKSSHANVALLIHFSQ